MTRQLDMIAELVRGQRRLHGHGHANIARLLTELERTGALPPAQ